MSTSSTPDNPTRPRTRRRLGRWGALVLVVAGGIGLTAWYRWEFTPPSEIRARIAQGREHLQTGRPRLALKAVADLPTAGRLGGEVLTIRGLAFAALDDAETTRTTLEEALVLDPDQPMALKVLAAVYFSRNDVDRGLEILQRAARLDPKDFRPWFAMGDVLQKLDRADEAARAYRSALDRKPDHHESRVGLIWALLKTEAPEAATPQIARALADRPDDPVALTLAAQQARDLGDPVRALELVDRCLSVDPNVVDALVLRARIRHGSGASDAALGDLELAARLAPQNLGALNLLTQVEAALGLTERAAASAEKHKRALKLSEAINALNEQIGARPDDPEPRWRMGQLAAEAGLTTLAIQSFQAALALDPNCLPARQGLAALNALPGATR